MRLISKTGAVTRPISLPVCRAVFDLYLTAWQVKEAVRGNIMGTNAPRAVLSCIKHVDAGLVSSLHDH